MLSTKQIIESKFLSVCPLVEAVQWLKSARAGLGRRGSFLTDNSHQEMAIAARNEPYLDFGLARYGTSEKAGSMVYARGDRGIRCAYLANFPNGGFGFIGNVFKLFHEAPQTIEELCALATNALLDDAMLRDLFEKKSLFSKLDDDKFQTVVVAVSDNERLRTPYDNSFLDGYSDYSYHSVFSSAWGLALTSPKSPQWAGVLCHLLNRCEVPNNFDSITAIERWYFAPADDRNIDAGFYLRARLADALRVHDALLTASDAAIRTSFYRRFDPNVYPLWEEFTSDVDFFLDSAIDNQNLWRTEELRNRLSQLCWDHPDPRSNLDMPNAYNAVRARMERVHPEWFGDAHGR